MFDKSLHNELASIKIACGKLFHLWLLLHTYLATNEIISPRVFRKVHQGIKLLVTMIFQSLKYHFRSQIAFQVSRSSKSNRVSVFHLWL